MVSCFNYTFDEENVIGAINPFQVPSEYIQEYPWIEPMFEVEEEDEIMGPETSGYDSPDARNTKFSKG